ncbi:MAG: MFS transporter [Roseiflexaceae bacterium]|jgi:MFS family permease
MQQSAVDRNIRLLVIELFWAAIAAAAYSFAAAFVIRLGGSNFIVSLITSAAAVVNAVTTIPFAALMERTSHRKPWMFASLFAFRMLNALLLFVPWLPAYRAEAVVIILLVANVPVALFNAGWLPMFADIIPIHHRARLFSLRNVTLGATMMVFTYAFGYLLDYLHTDTSYFNYQLLFVIAIVTSMASTYYVMQMEIPDTEIDTSAAVDRSWRGIWSLLQESQPYRAITINTLIFNLAAWAAIPFQPIYFVRTLGADDAWLGIWFAITNGGAILGNLFWPKLMERYGFHRILTIAALCSCLYFFAIGFVPNLTAILLFSLIIGMINPGIDISHFNILLQVCSPQRRALAMGLFVTVMNAGLLVSSLAVAPLIDWLGAQVVVIVLGVMRLGGALLFYVYPIRETAAETASTR